MEDGIKQNTYALLGCCDLLGLFFVVVRHIVGDECEVGDCGVQAARGDATGARRCHLPSANSANAM